MHIEPDAVDYDKISDIVATQSWQFNVRQTFNELIQTPLLVIGGELKRLHQVPGVKGVWRAANNNLEVDLAEADRKLAYIAKLSSHDDYKDQAIGYYVMVTNMRVGLHLYMLKTYPQLSEQERATYKQDLKTVINEATQHIQPYPISSFDNRVSAIHCQYKKNSAFLQEDEWHAYDRGTEMSGNYGPFDTGKKKCTFAAEVVRDHIKIFPRSSKRTQETKG